MKKNFVDNLHMVVPFLMTNHASYRYFCIPEHRHLLVTDPTSGHGMHHMLSAQA